jgi:two-component system chemotaxis response regulator CheB
MMPQARILIVDDSSLMRKLLRAAIEADASLVLAGAARNGRFALSMLGESLPDLVVLDIEMPELDGLATLIEIRKLYPKLPVIMFSSLSVRGAEITISALMRGASDYVTKPSGPGGANEAVAAISGALLPKIKALCAQQLKSGGVVALETKPRPCAPVSPGESCPIEIVAIGSSTGGPDALAAVLSQIPGDFPVPVVIVQHMPEVFTSFLAQRLNALTRLNVSEAQDGQSLAAGSALIAPGNFHVVVRRGDEGIVLKTNQEPEENSCRPSVDVLFRSVAELYGKTALAIVLTGMGQDGLVGAGSLVRNGSRIFVQDSATSVVWGMPGAIARADLAEQILPLKTIGENLVAAVSNSRARQSRPLRGIGASR